MRNWKLIFFSSLAVLGLTLSTGYAQQQDDEEVREALRLNLDQLSRNLEGLSEGLGTIPQDVAEEYLDILEDLQDVLDDYADYLEEDDETGPSHRVPAFVTLRQNLGDGIYQDDPEKLLDDLDGTIDEIKAVEQQHRVDFNTNSPRCCRLSRSLRKELVMVAELVEDYTDQQAISVLGRDDIKKYMKAATDYLKKLEEMEATVNLQEDDVREVLQALEALGLLGVISVDEGSYPRIVLPNIRVAPDAHGRHEIPEPPEPPEPPEVYYFPRGDKKAGARHQQQGNVLVSRSSVPIIIKNPSGNVVIKGSDERQLTAVLTLEVSASSHAKEKDYLDRTVLALGDDGGTYFVRVDLPRLSDHRTELLNSTLEVTVPRANRIECRNSFGQVEISDLKAAVKVDGENSQVRLTRITGEVTVDNSMGPVMLEDIAGRIRIENSYAPIDLISCRGDMVLENEYNAVTLTDTEGRLEINNTGKIEISDHVGPVFVESAYGTVEADRVDGDIEIKNMYQAILVSGVTGSATLENAYGEINAEEIGGSLSATATNGPIFVESLKGPIDLNGYNGNVSVVISSDFRGGSTITNTEGTVKIRILNKPDLLLSIHTVGGSISSSLPISVKTLGTGKEAELILGDGGERLDVSGSNTSVVIQTR